ncbi:TadE family type IV pilus minor pilin [Nocardioides guangzhouensis]|uniref:TadE family type IV pilus minor pilin n=1 Tax=Nocardioides guangzhouensis TaxID=2497878 RepID=UPI001FE6F8F0|nr:TadE family type IV pilus minor pilin [Nocardioides guangzhouensis]
MSRTGSGRRVDPPGGLGVARGRRAVGPARRDEVGAVTAETAMVLPLLVAVALVMVWVVSIGLAQMRATDGAREAARALARGESAATATGLARQAAPGIEVSSAVVDGEVRVHVEQPVVPPAGLLGHLPGAVVRADATALLEDDPHAGPAP